MSQSAAIFEISCEHCGLSFHPKREDEKFCCSGCRVVYDLICGEGFSSFYDLLGKKSLTPLNDHLQRHSDFSWAEAFVSDEHSHLIVRVGNLTCSACIWLIERLFSKQTGGVSIQINLNQSAMTLNWVPGNFDLVNFLKSLDQYGYPVSEWHGNHSAAPWESRDLLTRLGVTAGLALNTMAFSLPTYLGLDFANDLASLFRLVCFISASLAMAVGGSWFFRKAIGSLRMRTVHMDLPISLGVVIAYIGSIVGWFIGSESLLYFDFVALFITLMLLGRWLHIRMLEHNRSQLEAREKEIFSIQKYSQENQSWSKAAPTDLDEGDLVKIDDKSLLPVDGILLSGNGRFSLDWINGEPKENAYQKGQHLPAGARNCSGNSVELTVDESFQGSLMESLVGNCNNTAEIRNSNIIKGYLISVIVIAIAGGVYWADKSNELVKAFEVFISILVVSCPCALGLAMPLVDEVLNSRMRRLGIYVRRNSLWQKMSKVKNIVFDKTGTLTEATPQLLNSEVLDQLDQNQRIVLFELLKQNQHPYGRAIYDSLVRKFGYQKSLVNDFPIADIPGSGVLLNIGVDTWQLGKQSWIMGANDQFQCVFALNGKPLAKFKIGETTRSGVAECIGQLQRMDFRIRILSGDPNRERVEQVAMRSGISALDTYSSKSPQQKARYISERITGPTLYIGDGGNDGFALDAASCSGCPATGVKSIESRADFVFMDRNFRAVNHISEAAKRRKFMIRLIFTIAVLYNLIAVGLCLIGMMNPLLAAILMPISSLITISLAAKT